LKKLFLKKLSMKNLYHISFIMMGTSNFDWTNLAEENSNESMQSNEFSELPLAKLDLEIDFSRWVESRENNMEAVSCWTHKTNTHDKCLDSKVVKNFNPESSGVITVNRKCSSNFTKQSSLGVVDTTSKSCGIMNQYSESENMSMGTFSTTCSFESFNDIESPSATKDLEPNGAKNLSKQQISFRKRQLSIGKNTWGYQNYIRAVCKNKRSLWHPRTPDAMERISKRRFNGKVKVWRRKLHFWDAPRSIACPLDINENFFASYGGCGGLEYRLHDAGSRNWKIHKRSTNLSNR